METHRRLELTTPLMHGEDVKQLQANLRTLGFFQHTIDGAYGPKTAQAVYRYQYHLGYARPTQVAGEGVWKFLMGEAQTTPEMKKRAARRKKEAAKRVTKEHALAKKAITQLGTKEHPPGSNRVRYSVWYRLRGAWCAMAVSWCAWHVGLLFRYAYCPFVVADARAGRNGLSLAAGPFTGKLALFDWQDDGVADHIGICIQDEHLKLYSPEVYRAVNRRFGPLGPSDFWCLEGNTAVGNDSNGGEYMCRKRNRSQVQVFVKIGRSRA